MSQADALLESLAESVITHDHFVTDPDSYFIIDPDTRQISNLSQAPNVLMQNDHNSEVYTFEIPRYVEGHNMMLCNRIRLHYINIGQNKKEYKDVAELTLTANPENSNTLLSEWIIKRQAIQYNGSLNFLLQYMCVDDNGNVTYEWHTDIYTAVEVRKTFDNAEQAVFAYSDILEEWYRKLFSVEDAMIADINDVTQAQKTAIESKGAETLATIPDDYTETYNTARQALRTRANAIQLVASGEALAASDCSDDYLRGLKLFGKTTQVTTTGKNLWDNATAAMPSPLLTRTETGFIFNRGSNTGGYYASCQIPIAAGQTVTFSAVGSAYAPSLILYKDTIYGTQAHSGAGSMTYTASEDMTSAVFAVIINSIDDNCEVTNIQVELGSTKTDYEPYSGGVASPSPEWPQELVSLGSPDGVDIWIYGNNLADLNEAVLTHSTLVDVESGSVRLNMVDTYYAEIKMPYLNDYILSNQGKTFTFKVNNNPVGTLSIVIQGTRTLSTGGSLTYQEVNSYTAATAVNITPVGFVSIDMVSLRIGRQSVAHTDTSSVFSGISFSLDGAAIFEPAVERQILTISTPDGLPGIPVSEGGNYTDSDGQQWICDEIDFARGVHVQRVGLIKFDGTEGISQETRSNGSCRWSLVPSQLIPATNIEQGLCNYFAYGYEPIGSNRYDNTFCVWTTGHVYGRFDAVTTVADMSIWLSEMNAAGKPLTLAYALATPVETPLSDEELYNFSQLHSNYLTTTVVNSQNGYMEMVYNADLETYFNNLPKATDAQVRAAVDAWLTAHFTTAEGVSF